MKASRILVYAFSGIRAVARHYVFYGICPQACWEFLTHPSTVVHVRSSVQRPHCMIFTYSFVGTESSRLVLLQLRRSVDATAASGCCAGVSNVQYPPFCSLNCWVSLSSFFFASSRCSHVFSCASPVLLVCITFLPGPRSLHRHPCTGSPSSLVAFGCCTHTMRRPGTTRPIVLVFTARIPQSYQ